MNLSLDEWNVWFHAKSADAKIMADPSWKTAPHLLEDVYTFEDALMVGLILITFLKNSDRLKMACMAQLVNVIAPIMTDDERGAYRQSIYYPLLHASKYGRGVALRTILISGKHDTSAHEEVTDIDAAVVYQEEKEEVTVFAVNRHIDEDVFFEADLRCFGGYEVLEYVIMENENKKAVNTLDEEKVKPYRKKDYKMEQGNFSTIIKSCSWNVIRLGKKHTD